MTDFKIANTLVFAVFIVAIQTLSISTFHHRNLTFGEFGYEKASQGRHVTLERLIEEPSPTANSLDMSGFGSVLDGEIEVVSKLL